jgi:hypothetical protein
MDLDVRLIYRLIPRTHGLLQSYIFLHLVFLLNGIDNLLSNLTWTWMYFSSIDWYRERMVYLNILPLLVPLQSVAFFEPFFFCHGCIRHKSVCFWVSVVRYALYRFACNIWRRGVYLVPEKKATFCKKKWAQKYTFLKMWFSGLCIVFFYSTLLFSHSCRRLFFHSCCRHFVHSCRWHHPPSLPSPCKLQPISNLLTKCWLKLC